MSLYHKSVEHLLPCVFSEFCSAAKKHCTWQTLWIDGYQRNSPNKHDPWKNNDNIIIMFLWHCRKRKSFAGAFIFITWSHQLHNLLICWWRSCDMTKSSGRWWDGVNCCFHCEPQLLFKVFMCLLSKYSLFCLLQKLY